MWASWAVKGMAALLSLSASCGPNPIAIKNCAGQVIETVLMSNTPDPTPDNPQPVKDMDCLFGSEPADASGRAPYTINGIGVLNGWEWWTACVETARAMGWTLPATKITGDANDSSMTPRLEFVFDTAPIIGRGSGHYRDPFQAGNIAVYRRAHIVGV